MLKGCMATSHVYMSGGIVTWKLAGWRGAAEMNALSDRLSLLYTSGFHQLPPQFGGGWREGKRQRLQGRLIYPQAKGIQRAAARAFPTGVLCASVCLNSTTR